MKRYCISYQLDAHYIWDDWDYCHSVKNLYDNVEASDLYSAQQKLDKEIESRFSGDADFSYIITSVYSEPIEDLPSNTDLWR